MSPPDSWYGLGALVVATVGGWVTIWLKQRGNGRKMTRVGDQVAGVQSSVNDVNNQVSNNHDTNLRDDISAVLQDVRLIRRDISRISDDIQVLRGELTSERDARTDLEQRFDDDRESRGGDH